MTRIYYMGLVKKSANTVVLQAKSSKDELSCELWQYYGERINTKSNLKANRTQLLAEINKSYGTDFKHILID